MVGLAQAYGGFCFVCDHGKHRNAKQYNFECIFSPLLPVPKVSPKIVSFSKTNLIIQFHYTNKVETPVSIFGRDSSEQCSSLGGAGIWQRYNLYFTFYFLYGGAGIKICLFIWQRSSLGGLARRSRAPRRAARGLRVSLNKYMRTDIYIYIYI